MTRVLSCIQPTGDVHLGNYLGALRNWVNGQHEKDVYHGIVDLHALTVTTESGVVGESTVSLAAMLFAIGLDPDVATIFVQSHVPEHSQLGWVMECTVSFGELSRMTQFKDKSQKQGSDNSTVGLFTYPILQAADILLYDATVVPVGEDQRQHIELTRNIAERFNQRFGETFVVPEVKIVDAAAKIYDLQNPESKMSKSGESPQGILWLLDEPSVITKKIKSAVTDTETEIRFDAVNKPGVSNLLTLASLATRKTVPALEAEFQGLGYGNLKSTVAEAVVEVLEPIRTTTDDLLADPAELDRILARGAEKAEERANRTLAKVHTAVGFLPRA